MQKTISFRIFQLIILLWLCFLSPPAHATFPGESIAFWETESFNESNDPLYQKIYGLAKEKKYQEALNLLEGKEKSASGTGTPMILKAILLNDLGQPIEALNAMRTGYMEQSRHPAIHFGYCQIYRKLGSAEPSERACQIAVQQHPNSPEAHFEYAETLKSLGKMRLAIKELVEAAALDPAYEEYPYEIGQLYSYLNEFDEAEASYQKAISVNPRHLEALYQLAYLSAARGNAEASYGYIQTLMDLDRNHPLVSSARILKDYLDQKATDKLTLNNVPYLYHKKKSKSMYTARKYGLALLEIQTAARIKSDDPEIQEILVGLSSLLLRQFVTEKAVNQLLQLAQGNSSLQARCYQELGDLMVFRGNMSKAREQYEHAVQLGDPGNLAKTTLEELPEQSPDFKNQLNPDEMFIQPAAVLNKKGEIFAHFKMYKRAVLLYSASIQMDPEHLMSMLNMGAAYYKLGNLERAITILKRTLKTHPNHPHMDGHRLLLAQVYAKKGEALDAIENLKIALKLNPNLQKIIQSDPGFESLRNRQDFQKLFQ